MTPKERMLLAINREKPDRLPVSIHQWQQYHLEEYMDGMDALDAFQATGMDAAIQYFEAMGQFWIPEAEKYALQTPFEMTLGLWPYEPSGLARAMPVTPHWNWRQRLLHYAHSRTRSAGSVTSGWSDTGVSPVPWASAGETSPAPRETTMRRLPVKLVSPSWQLPSPNAGKRPSPQLSLGPFSTGPPHRETSQAPSGTSRAWFARRQAGLGRYGGDTRVGMHDCDSLPVPVPWTGDVRSERAIRSDDLSATITYHEQRVEVGVMKSSCQLLVLVLVGCAQARAETTERPPNIVYIMSDELAYYELSHMGNPRIRTPRIDRMAAEGIRFTQALAGSSVCAPLRCTLMTGKHAGHASVRANDGGTPLRAEEPTIASMLGEIGYATGGFGKWGCGGRDSTGVPEKHGFNVFFGYYDQVHAHSYYPPYLIRNSQEVKLAGNRGGRSGQSYSHYVIMDEALKFIRANKDRSFFCYLPITPPHGMYDIPADDPAWEHYRGADWIKDPDVPQDAKNYAAMVTMVDRNVGQVLDLLKELDLEDNTIVFFTGDNGGQDRFRDKQHPRGYFGPNVDPRTGVEFRGGKGNLYEGGLRIPFIVRWPGKIQPGRVSDLLFYQPDVLPTLAALTGAKAPAEIDGLSILPELIGAEDAGRKQEEHEFLYWEYRSQVAVRMGRWKAIRPKNDAPWELYDLEKDISETTSVADHHPEILARMTVFAKRSHVPVRPGTFQDRTRHERDRKAKWGSTRAEADNYQRKVNRIRDNDLIPAMEMKLVHFSSENRANDRRAIYAIDGNPRTVWHSQFSEKLARHPHELVIDLGAVYEIRGFRYLARQDSGFNGTFAETEFFVSESPDAFEDPVAKVTFQRIRTAQDADCKRPVRGRYVRVRVLSEVNGKPWGSAAEIGVVQAK